MWLGPISCGVLFGGLLLIVVAFLLAYARKIPGLRRKKQDPNYQGPWRRRPEIVQLELEQEDTMEGKL